MKGDVVVNTIGLFVIAVISLVLFFIVLPQVIELLWKEVALASPDVVSKEISEFIAISGAAPYSIEISYKPSNYPYDVEIKDRIVTVTISGESPGVYETSPSTGTIPVNHPTISYSGVNSFLISKDLMIVLFGDVNLDCMVNQADVNLCNLLDTRCDWDYNGAVDNSDTAIVQSKVGNTCFTSPGELIIRGGYTLDADWVERE